MVASWTRWAKEPILQRGAANAKCRPVFGKCVVSGCRSTGRHDSTIP